MIAILLIGESLIFIKSVLCIIYSLILLKKRALINV